jgi:hypothetical protein
MAELRIKRVEIRYRKSEYECLSEKAAKKNITVSEYVRLITLNDCKK